MFLIKSCFRWFIIVTFLIIILTVDGRVTAQIVYWSDRGDRFEGIITDRAISGAYFNLLGIQVNKGGQLDPSSSQLNLSFWLPSPDTVTIKVWEPSTNYWMVPKQKNFVEGSHTFTWPAAPVITSLIKSLKFDLAKLQILVTNSTETLYFPAQLFTRTQPSQGRTYQFTFESKGGVELKGIIVREDGLELVRSFELTEDYPGIICLTWDGLNDSGEEVQTGIYSLHLEGIIYLRESDEDLVIDIRFMHRR